MAGGPPDLVDCEQLAAEGTTLERVFELGQLPRLQDLLADRRGALQARFGFAKAASGRSVVVVSIAATPRLVCQRCLGAYEIPVVASSEVEIADLPLAAGTAGAAGAVAQGDVYVAAHGMISLRELAEEELLLALPMIPACSMPEECGRAPVAEVSVRPFAGLRDLLKKQDRN